jgi:hypothetical protein
MVDLAAVFINIEPVAGRNLRRARPLFIAITAEKAAV